MLYWKKKEKFEFPDLEERWNMLDNWIEDEYADEIYPDEILKEFSSTLPDGDFDDEGNRRQVYNNLSDMRKEDYKDKLTTKLAQIRTMRIKSGAEVDF